jgi:hypothetical protein
VLANRRPVNDHELNLFCSRTVKHPITVNRTRHAKPISISAHADQQGFGCKSMALSLPQLFVFSGSHRELDLSSASEEISEMFAGPTRNMETIQIIIVTSLLAGSLNLSCLLFLVGPTKISSISSRKRVNVGNKIPESELLTISIKPADHFYSLEGF